jgi:hypothetical protein
MNLTCAGRLPLIVDFIIANVRVAVGFVFYVVFEFARTSYVPALMSVDFLFGTLIKAPQKVTIPPFDCVPQLFEN